MRCAQTRGGRRNESLVKAINRSEPMDAPSLLGPLSLKWLQNAAALAGLSDCYEPPDKLRQKTGGRGGVDEEQTLAGSPGLASGFSISSETV